MQVAFLVEYRTSFDLEKAEKAAGPKFTGKEINTKL